MIIIIIIIIIISLKGHIKGAANNNRPRTWRNQSGQKDRKESPWPADIQN